MSNEIRSSLNMLQDEIIEVLFQSVAQLVTGNLDFNMVIEGDNSEVIQILNREKNIELDVDWNLILAPEGVELFTKFSSCLEGECAFSTEEKRELMAQALENDGIFEGICILGAIEDEGWNQLMTMMGCNEKYENIKKDSVYLARKEYFDKMVNYVLACVNFYGVEKVDNVLKIIREYEDGLIDCGKYIRNSGNYQKTIAFTPEYMGVSMLQYSISCAQLGVLTSIDGLFIHPCYMEEYDAETEQLMSYIETAGEEVGEKIIDFYTNKSQACYRKIYNEASTKKMFIPIKGDLMKYVQDYYVELTFADRKLKKHLEKDYKAEIEKAASDEGVEFQQYLSLFVTQFHIISSDVYGVEVYAPEEYFEAAFNLLSENGIEVSDENEYNQFLQEFVAICNSARRWANHGYTPDEMQSEQ